MFNIFKRKTTPKFTIRQLDSGRFGIVNEGDFTRGENYARVVKSYSRKRDAVRGAARMGITLTD